MKVLELFAGTRSIGLAFESKLHEVFSVDWDDKFVNIDLYIDIELLEVDDIIRLFGIPDVIWASPDCTTYSIAAISHHRGEGYSPKSEYAEKSDRLNIHLWSLIKRFKELNPKLIYYVENPMGTYRKMPWVKDKTRYTVTYCQYGDTRMKPTDIFTNHPEPKFKPMCHNGDTCHQSAPRGSRTGTQGLLKVDRSRIPQALCDHIVSISEALEELEEEELEEMK
jgi:hypothetical protein